MEEREGRGGGGKEVKIKYRRIWEQSVQDR